MAKISINLLPVEFITTEAKKANFYKVQAIGIVVILTMVFLASLMIALRILQSHNIDRAKVLLDESEQKVSNLKRKEVSLTVLKNRLTIIDKYLGVSSKQVSIYKLIDKLIPPAITVTSFSIEPSGGVALTGIAQDSTSLDNLINSLTSKDINEGKIAGVSVDSLNRGRDGIYRLSLKVQVN